MTMRTMLTLALLLMFAVSASAQIPPAGQLVFNDRINVGVNGVAWYPIVVPHYGRLSGQLRGSGGWRGEVEMHLMTDRQLRDFRNGKPTKTKWSSQGAMTVMLVDAYADAGMYYLVVSNRSGMAGRSVRGQIYLSRY
jgi:hypothetical protein